MKKYITFICSLLFLMLCSANVNALDETYLIKSGDTLWKIAVANQVGLSELIAKNPQLSNPSMIMPGQKILIPSQADVKTAENNVIRLVNIERGKVGLPSFKTNWELSRIARYKSQDMINKGYFSHISPTYGSPFNMIENFGIKFSAAGENIAMGQKTPEQVMIAWMNSPGHRSNILNPAYTEIGVGLAKDNNGSCYWTQMFIKPIY